MDEKSIPEHGLAGQFIADAESHILLSGSTQISGKTMATNRIVEKFYELGYTIIHITDVKSHKIEAGFAAFKATDKKHRLLQKEYGVYPRAYPIKKYHLLTRDIPTKAISDTQFFTVPFKQLDRDLLRFLFDNPSSETTIETIGSIISDMGNTETVFELYYQLALRASRASGDEESSSVFIDDPESYHLNINTAEKWA